MSVRAYYDTWCDGPGPYGEGCILWADWATGASARESRRIAKLGGWVYRRDVGDLCPDCQERMERSRSDDGGEK